MTLQIAIEWFRTVIERLGTQGGRCSKEKGGDGDGDFAAHNHGHHDQRVGVCLHILKSPYKVTLQRKYIRALTFQCLVASGKRHSLVAAQARAA